MPGVGSLIILIDVEKFILIVDGPFRGQDKTEKVYWTLA